MSNGEWIAVAGLAVTALGGLGWLGSLTWHGGRQSQRLDNALDQIAKLEKTQGEHANAIATWPQVIQLLEEVRGDVKNLLLGKLRAPRQGGAD